MLYFLAIKGETINDKHCMFVAFFAFINTTRRLTPCLQKKIDKTTYLVEVHSP